MQEQQKQLEAKFQARQFEEIISEVSAFPDNNPLKYLYLSRCYQATQQFDEAIKQAEAGAQKFPQLMPKLLLIKAMTHHSLNQFDKELEVYEKIMEVQKGQGDQPLLLNYAKALARQNQQEKAIQFFNAAITADEKSQNGFAAAGLLTNIYVDQKKIPEALELLEKTLKIEGKNIQPDIIANLWINKSACESQTHKYEQSLESLKKAQSLNPNLPGLKDHFITVYDTLREDCEKKKQYKESLQYCELNIDLIKDEKHKLYLDAMLTKAICLQELRENGAIEAYEAYLRLVPDSLNGLVNLAVEYAYQQNFQKAIECYEKVIKINPNDDITFSNYGKAYLELKPPNYERALQCFNEAIKINPKALLAITNKAQLLLRQGKKIEAIKELQLVDQYIQVPENSQNLSEVNKEFIKKAVSQIMKIQNEFDREKKAAEEALSKLNQQDPEVQRVLDEIARIEKQINTEHAEELAKANKEKQESKPNSNFEEQLKKISEMVQKVQEAQTKVEIKHEEIKQEQIKEDIKIEKLEKKVDDMEECIKLVGFEKVNKVKETYAKWRTEYKDGYDYAKAFYWTFINYCDAQKIASTDVIQTDSGHAVGTKTKVAVKVATAVLDFGSNIPIFGSIFSAINQAVEAGFEAYKEFKEEEKRNAILSVIMKNQDAHDKEAWSILVATAAQLIAERKRSYFAQGIVKQKSKFDQFTDWVQKKIQAIRDAAIGQKVDMYNTFGGQEASADIVILLAFILKNHKELAENESQSLDITIADIVYLENGEITEAYRAMLNKIEEREKENNTPKQVEQGDNACTCQLI